MRDAPSPRPIANTEATRRWAVDVLRRIAADLGQAPRHQLADALLRLGAPLEDLIRVAALTLPGH